MTFKEIRRENRPIYLPDIEKFPEHMNQIAYAPLEYLKVSVFDVKISRHTLENYLTRPDEFLRLCDEAVKYAADLHNNPNHFWRKHMDFNLYDVIVGWRKPMQLSPWELVDDSDDYLTVYARDPYQDYRPISVRHYISMKKHNEMLLDASSGVKHVIGAELKKVEALAQEVRNVVEATVQKTVDSALNSHAKTLEQIRLEKYQLEKQLQALEVAEQREMERERLRLEREEQRKQAAEQKRLEAEARKATLDRSGYVYLIREDARGTYKIGRAKDPNNRLGTFNVKLPFPVEFICTIRTVDRITLEKKLHAKFDSKRVDGEWFALDERDVRFLARLARFTED